MNDFFAQAIPEPHTVLGLRLAPFTAGRLLLLHRVGNHFVAEACEDAPAPLPGPDDLFTGVWLCSQQFSPDFEAGKAWIYKLAVWRDAMRQWVAAYQKKFGPINLNEKCAAFARYLAAGSRFPNATPVRRGGGGPPHVLQMPKVELIKIDLLRHHVCRDEAEFLARPWGQSLWDWTTLKGLLGDCQFIADEAFDEALKFAREDWHRAEALRKGAGAPASRRPVKKRKAPRG